MIQNKPHKSEMRVGETKFYKEYMDNIEVVFDVGCRNDTLYLDLKPEINCHLFEPFYYWDIEEKLKKYKNYKLNKIALGSKEDKLIFNRHRGSFFPESIHHYFDRSTNIELPVTTLEKYCNEHNITKIDLLKIDAEGSEYDIIKGLNGKILPKYTQIEFCFTYGKNGTYTLYDLLDLLEGNPNIYYIDEDRPFNLVITEESLNYRVFDIENWVKK